MVTPAPLTAVALTTTNNTTNTSMNSLKRKDEKSHISEVRRKSIECHISTLQQSANEIDGSSIRTIPTFRIPKIAR